MKPVIAMVLTGLCLSTVGLFVKLIDSQIHFMTLNFLRFFIGFLFLLMVMPIIDSTVFKFKKKDLKDYSLIGLLFALALSCYSTAFYFTNMQTAVMINYSYPIYLLFFAYFILKEQITRTKVISLCLALVGLIIINPLSSTGNSFGNMLAVFGAFFFALLIVYMRKEDQNHTIGSVVWFLGFASLFLFPFALYYGFEGLTQTLPYVLSLGIISTGIAYFFYNIGLEQLDSETSAIITLIVTPLTSIILALVVINEELVGTSILGGLFLLSSGIYLNLSSKLSSLTYARFISPQRFRRK